MEPGLRTAIRDEARLGVAFAAGLVLATIGPHVDARVSWAAAALVVVTVAWATRPLFAAAIGAVVELLAAFSSHRTAPQLHLDANELGLLAAAILLALWAGRAGRAARRLR